MRCFGRFQIDFETHPIFIEDEVDDSTHLDKTGRVPNCQNAASLEGTQDLGYLQLVRGGDEKDMASSCLG
jgi:hypothetical protein